MPTQPPLFEYLQALTSFGPRPIGSRANLAAGNYIAGVFTRIGLEVEREEYACPHWQPILARLEVNGQTLAVSANPYSPDCDLNAEVVVCSTLDELRAAHVEGKLLVLHGAIVSNPVVPEYVVYAQGPDALAEQIKAKNPAAVVAVEVNPLNPFLFLEDWNFAIPNARVLAESGRALAQNAGSTARLTLRSHLEHSTTANLVARHDGRGARRIVVCAHFDTTFETPGAMDNASGVALLLALAARFRELRLEHALEWVAFSGEDSGGVDFFPYAEKHGDFENIRAVINMDLVGTWLGSTSITTLGEDEAVNAVAHGLAERHADLVWVDPWYESDHSAFFFRGVPAVAFSTKGFPAEIYHRPSDTDVWISPSKLERALDLVSELIVTLDTAGKRL